MNVNDPAELQREIERLGFECAELLTGQSRMLPGSLPHRILGAEAEKRKSKLTMLVRQRSAIARDAAPPTEPATDPTNQELH